MRRRTSAPEGQLNPRRGVVIIAVLLVVALLSLAAYQYTDRMSSEHLSAHSFLRAAQARVLADSGVHYAAAALATPDNITNCLAGNPFSNPGCFQDQVVQDGSDGSPKGMFSIISPADPNNPPSDGSNLRYGVTCEAGKINLNTVLLLDPTGNTLYSMLMQLPNMTDDVANAIVDWIDPDNTPRSNGAESDYYSGQQPPYQAKNGPLDSLEELLLVRGVTPQLLFGDDRNRNGVVEPEEDNGNGLGWSAFLTVYSRELNVDSTGVPRTWINDSNLQNLQTNLANTQLSADLQNFILLYRIYGGTAALPKDTQAQPASGFDPSTLNLSQQKGGTQIKSLYDLINVYVAVPAPMQQQQGGQQQGGQQQGGQQQGGQQQGGKTTYYASPLLDPNMQAQQLPILFDKTATTQSQYYWGRINVNTAPQEVLMALTALGQNQAQGGTTSTTQGQAATTTQPTGQTQTQGLAVTDVQSIVAKRPPMAAGAAPDPSFQTPAWLLIQANVTVPTLKSVEQYITTTSQVYRMQVVGYFDNGGPSARIEAVVDTNAGQPRIVYWRDLSELGKGYTPQQNN